MHSSRMRTARSSSRGGLHQAPPGPDPPPPAPGTPLLDEAPPGTDTPPGPGTLPDDRQTPVKT